MTRKWYSWEMFIELNGDNIFDYHLNKNVKDVTNDCTFRRILCPIDKWKYNDMRMPKSVKEVGAVTYAGTIDGVKYCKGFFIAFEIAEGVDAKEEAFKIYNWVQGHRGFW